MADYEGTNGSYHGVIYKDDHNTVLAEMAFMFALIVLLYFARVASLHVIWDSFGIDILLKITLV